MELVGHAMQSSVVVINPQRHRRAKLVNVEQPTLQAIADCGLRSAD
jgi:hypothetical protein